MTEEQKALREAVARALYSRGELGLFYGETWEAVGETVKHEFLRDAETAIAVALEMAAKELDGWADIYGRTAAAAIRALIKES